jgi:hypothetical protein
MILVASGAIIQSVEARKEWLAWLLAPVPSLEQVNSSTHSIQFCPFFVASRLPKL